MVRRRLRTHGPEQTEALGRRLAESVPDGVVVGLVGQLGAGKTCFVRGFATGLGIDAEEVASPTFVYLVDYQGSRRRLWHADLYRLENAAAAGTDAFESIGLIAAIEDPDPLVVEWWNHYIGPSPSRLILVEFEIENIEDRSITLELRGTGLEKVAATIGDEVSSAPR